MKLSRISKVLRRQKTEPKPKASLTDWQIAAFKWLDTAINVVVSPAQADEADLNIDSHRNQCSCGQRWKVVLLRFNPFMRRVLIGHSGGRIISRQRCRQCAA